MRHATIARGHGPRSHGFAHRSLPSRIGRDGSVRYGASVTHCPLGRVGIVLRAEHYCSAVTQAPRVNAVCAMREAPGFLSTGVLPNWSLERTSTGKPLGPRAAHCHHASRGPSAFPVVSAQLKR